MAASSVTGTGPGESHGLQKPELHSGCGCCGPASETPATNKRKTHCVKRHSSASKAVGYSSRSGSLRLGSCM